MKKSTIAVAALLTVLSTAPVMSVAYADEGSAATPATTPASGDASGNASGDTSGDASGDASGDKSDE